MQSSRLLALLLRLQAEGRVSAQELAQHFEVSVRTIYRDIDALSAAGVPVYAERGRRGGFQLQAGYRTQLTGLDRPEAASLFLAGAPFVAEQLGLGKALETMRLKLLAALPEGTARDAERVSARFHLDPVAWFQGPDEQRFLPALATALWSGRQLRMRYDSWKGVVDRVVSPLGLVLKGGLWYLVAASGEQPRTYRVGYIQTLTVAEEPALVLPRFRLERYWRGFAADYEARMSAQEAHIRARPELLKPLARLSHAMSQAVLRAGPPDAQGWHRFNIPIESIEVAVGELLKLGPGVQALGPPALVRGLREAVSALQGVYGKKPVRRRSVHVRPLPAPSNQEVL
jgi:predicted DNA-binding transcriptional regulator YafY